MNLKLGRFFEMASTVLGVASVLGIVAGATLVNGRSPWGLCLTAAALFLICPILAIGAIVLGHITHNRTGYICGYASLLLFVPVFHSLGFPICAEHFH